jgi:predicted nucleotidyltransferase
MPELGMIVPNMGTHDQSGERRVRPPRAASLADALFTDTQQRVLGLLFGQPDRSFYATEIIGLSGGGSGAIQRELLRLSDAGLVTTRRVGNQKHYQANRQSPVFAELCGIAQKTIGLADPLRDVLSTLAAQILGAFIYGSVARREDTAASDIDMMVVSDTLAYADMYATLEAAHARLGRVVNPTILTRKDYSKRLKAGGAFMKRVLAQPRLWLIGDDESLGIRGSLRPRQTAEAGARRSR